MSHLSAPLLLAGLGHAHLFVLESLAREGRLDLPVVLVTPPEYDYSGMISGVLAEQYRPEQARLDPDGLARAAGVTWIPGRVRRIDPWARRVVLDDGSSLCYRLLSLDIGSRSAGANLPGVGEHAIPVRPVRHALRFRAAAGRAARDATPADPARIVIVGAGAAGTELALCLAPTLARRCSPDRFRILLLERGSEILEGYPRRFRDLALRRLRERDVQVRYGAEVEAAQKGRLLLQDGESPPFHALLWATGPAAPGIFRRSGLATDDDGYLRVGPDLRTPEHAEIFAAGDCAAIQGFPWMAKAGVYAVREGPVLARNLRRAIAGKPLERYSPQREWLSLMNTGDGRALGSYRGRTFDGRVAWWLKNWIDTRFVERFQGLASRRETEEGPARLARSQPEREAGP